MTDSRSCIKVVAGCDCLRGNCNRFICDHLSPNPKSRASTSVCVFARDLGLGDRCGPTLSVLRRMKAVGRGSGMSRMRNYRKWWSVCVIVLFLYSWSRPWFAQNHFRVRENDADYVISLHCVYFCVVAVGFRVAFALIFVVYRLCL